MKSVYVFLAFASFGFSIPGIADDSKTIATPLNCLRAGQVISVIIDGTTRQHTCTAEEVLNDDQSRTCKDTLSNYNKETQNREEKEQDRLKRRQERKQELERNAIERQKDFQDSLRDIDREIAEVTKSFNTEIRSIQKDSRNISKEGAAEIRSLTNEITKLTGTERSKMILKHKVDVQKHLSECDKMAQELIAQYWQANTAGVQARASGQLQQKSVNFRSTGDTQKMKENVNKALNECRNAKNDLDEQMKIELKNIETQANALNQELLQLQKTLQEEIQSLGQEATQAQQQYQSAIQRLEQQKQTLQQNLAQQNMQDAQEIAQLNMETSSATPLLQSFTGGKTIPDLKLNQKSEFMAILEEGVVDDCCIKDANNKWAPLERRSANSFLKGVCDKRNKKPNRNRREAADRG